MMISFSGGRPERGGWIECDGTTSIWESVIHDPAYFGAYT